MKNSVAPTKEKSHRENTWQMLSFNIKISTWVNRNCSLVGYYVVKAIREFYVDKTLIEYKTF